MEKEDREKLVDILRSIVNFSGKTLKCVNENEKEIELIKQKIEKLNQSLQDLNKEKEDEDEEIPKIDERDDEGETED